MKTKISYSIRSLLLLPLVLALFALALSSNAFGVVPAPDGGYPGNNTAEGTSALFSLTTGINNTAVGANALLHATIGLAPPVLRDGTRKRLKRWIKPAKASWRSSR